MHDVKCKPINDIIGPTMEVKHMQIKVSSLKR